MLDQRLRRWSNIVQMFYKCFVFLLAAEVQSVVIPAYCLANHITARDASSQQQIYTSIAKFVAGKPASYWRQPHGSNLAIVPVVQAAYPIVHL